MSQPSAPRALALLLLLPSVSVAAAPPSRTIEGLIDQLAHVRQGDFGYSDSITGSIFLPLDREGQLHTALLFQQPAARSDTLRELVCQGPAAIPHLLAHLQDKRPTRLTVGSNAIVLMVLGQSGPFGADLLNPLGRRPPPSSYTVTVGDLCYVALGQIINRDHAVVRYVPTGIVLVNPAGGSEPHTTELTREWRQATPAHHKASLIADVRKALNEDRRIGACKRLAFYYPDALEPLALRLLSVPTCDSEDVRQLVEEELYPAPDAKKRRGLFDAFVARHGKAGREAALRKLFADLEYEESAGWLVPEEEQGRSRRLLVELFGYDAKVRSGDRPDFLGGIDRGEKRRLIGEALVHLPGGKIDRAVRDLLRSIKDDDDLAVACLECLLGQGYDADVERYCRRRLPLLPETDRGPLREVLGKLGWMPLHVAVARGRADLVESLLAAGARPDAPARSGVTPLHLAARAGEEAILRRLLARKANLEGKGAAGFTPAQEAARRDHDGSVLLLVKHGCAIADIHVAALAGRVDVIDRFLQADPTSLRAKTAGGRTPLFLAVRHGHVPAAQRLLARGARADEALHGGWLPLHEAAAAGQAAVARVLLAHQAAVDARLEENDITPLHVAADHGHAEVVRLLLEAKANVDLVDQTGRTALFRAIEAGQEAVVELLLKGKANPRLRRKDKTHPLHAAVSAGKVNLVVLLLKAGVDTERRAPETGETALHRAVREGAVDVTGVLLDRGARINARDALGNTPLFYAIDQGHEAIARLLLARKADPEVANSAGATPLHAAAWFGRTRLAEELLRLKVNVEGGRTLLGESALHLAAQKGHAEMVRLLLAHKADPLAGVYEGKSALHTAVWWGQGEVAEILLARGVPVDVRDDEGLSPLHEASRSWEHSEAMVRLLLRHKANVHAATKLRWRPLHYAAQAGNVQAVALLLDRKAAVNVRELQEGRTPLHLAIEAGVRLEDPTEAASLPVVRLLLEHKPDVTIRDRQGRTPLALAAEMKYAKVQQLLRKHGARK